MASREKRCRERHPERQRGGRRSQRPRGAVSTRRPPESHSLFFWFCRSFCVLCPMFGSRRLQWEPTGYQWPNMYGVDCPLHFALLFASGTENGRRMSGNLLLLTHSASLRDMYLKYLTSRWWSAEMGSFAERRPAGRKTDRGEVVGWNRRSTRQRSHLVHR